MARHKEVATWKSGVIDFTAGSLGGVALVYVGQPLDTVKVKMQTYPQLYSSMIDCCKKVWRDEGLVRGLYAGTIPAILANVAENSVLFACYGFCQKIISLSTGTKNVEDMSILANASAGCLASFFSSFTLCPTELLKIQLQAAHEEATKLGNTSKINLGLFGLTKQIIRQDGLRGLFKGFGPTVAREMPGYFVFFGGYEATRTLLAPADKPKEECGALATMAAGGVGGIALWTVIFPVDVIKSRVQASSQQNTANFVTQMTDIVKKEGVLALYNGLQPTLIRTIPASAVLFLVYEYSKKIMNTLFL
ncbi:mitochondrial ornithine transporter 1 [Diaphorina citri]|uniref:Mitochondrial ornithine transporter 1 n=1 Tax=Diaphorina citri TaxID=121845 RepID=A0A3Q0ITN2_DIACI|nr:mitochondrial ornithine transporter 1 [Diaphorina citri]